MIINLLSGRKKKMFGGEGGRGISLNLAQRGRQYVIWEYVETRILRVDSPVPLCQVIRLPCLTPIKRIPGKGFTCVSLMQPCLVFAPNPRISRIYYDSLPCPHGLGMALPCLALPPSCTALLCLTLRSLGLALPLCSLALPTRKYCIHLRGALACSVDFARGSQGEARPCIGFP